MKRLYIIRHAKSSWKDHSLYDWERPLNKRGKRNIPEMGSFLKKKNTHIDLMISSHAERALTTAIGIGEYLNYAEEKIQVTEELYHAGYREIYGVLNNIPDSIQSVAIFGHNPGFTTFANSLTNGHIDNIPTCGVCAVDLPVTSWQDVAPGIGKMDYFMYPKGLM